MLNLIVSFPGSKTRLTRCHRDLNRSPFRLGPRNGNTKVGPTVFPPIGGTFKKFPLDFSELTFDFKVIDFVQSFGQVDLIVEILSINHGDTEMKNGSHSWYQEILRKNDFT